ncbi:zinc finger BED domain-containing protein RICESLEEPER 2-like [Camellia sinensis]|uniref:zinc finger BED domain-containing protein RICESLEEPER 2-like n=1 Tax=Camellia sinensis TaxID=4442 RepID=UPI0010363328|nr:zinc finger BED domain-containing protein RICESLEEPER 2-like [Camellia sinensis]
MIKSDILKIYDAERVKILSLVENNKSRVEITTNIWTASNQKKGFMVVTTHFIDDSCTLQCRILRFIYVPCPQTKEVLCDTLHDCMMDWNIDRKIFTVTVDNCSTNDAMITMLMDKLSNPSLLLSDTLFHMRCCTHILYLIVKDGLDVIRVGIEKIRESVAYWTATPKRQEKFEETVNQLRNPHTKKLGLDCATRWNLTYLMLETTLFYKNVFSRLKNREPQYKTVPSEEEWEFAREISGRYKTSVFEFCFEKLYGDKAEEEIDRVCQICYDLLHEYQNRVGMEIDVVSESSIHLEIV